MDDGMKSVRLLRARRGHEIGDVVEFSTAKANRLINAGEAEKPELESVPNENGEVGDLLEPVKPKAKPNLKRGKKRTTRFS